MFTLVEAQRDVQPISSVRKTQDLWKSKPGTTVQVKQNASASEQKVCV